jgi:hypothetical protein
MAFESYVVKTLEELGRVIKGLPDDMKVDMAEGVSIAPKTVGELRALKIFPTGRLRIMVPRERYLESAVKIELVS